MSRIKIPETRHLVLSVNDNPTADRDFHEWLNARGCVVLRANSTQHAMLLLDRAQVDVVISDLARDENGMNVKMAGMQLAQQIRQRDSRVPIAIYTMKKAPEVHDLAIEAGANFVTEKQAELRSWLSKLGI